MDLSPCVHSSVYKRALVTAFHQSRNAQDWCAFAPHQKGPQLAGPLQRPLFGGNKWKQIAYQSRAIILRSLNFESSSWVYFRIDSVSRCDRWFIAGASSESITHRFILASAKEWTGVVTTQYVHIVPIQIRCCCVCARDSFLVAHTHGGETTEGSQSSHTQIFVRRFEQKWQYWPCVVTGTDTRVHASQDEWVTAPMPSGRTACL